MKQEHQVGSLNSGLNELQQQVYAQRLELQDAPRSIVYEGKSASRYSDTKNTRDGINKESSRSTSRRILCTEIERES